MAPVTRAATNISKKSAVKKSEDHIVKRPVRGFHRFGNGILNVTPKGDETELVNHNQDAPLLRLPPELRSRIWEYILGGMTVRKIYTETALLSYKLNTFSFDIYPGFTSELKYYKSFQRAQIQSIQFEVAIECVSDSMAASYSERILSDRFAKRHLDVLTGLKHIKILILYDHIVSDGDSTVRQHMLEVAKNNIRNWSNVLLADQPFQTTCEIAGMTWTEYAGLGNYDNTLFNRRSSSHHGLTYFLLLSMRTYESTPN